MKRIIFILLIAINALLAETFKEEREVGDFEHIQFLGDGKLIIIQGEENTLTIEKMESSFDSIESYVDDHVLTIKNRIGDICGQKYIYTVMVCDLKSIDIEGNGIVEVLDLNVDDLTFDLQGSVKAKVRLLADNFNATISGSSMLQTFGSVKEQCIHIKGNGIYDGSKLSCSDSIMQLYGSGSAILQVIKFLEVKIRGSGTVEYVGDPQHLNIDVKGRGNVFKM